MPDSLNQLLADTASTKEELAPLARLGRLASLADSAEQLAPLLLDAHLGDAKAAATFLIELVTDVRKVLPALVLTIFLEAKEREAGVTK